METNREKLHFSSDYMEGAHPKVLEALVRTNMVSTPGYGEDEYCRKAREEILAACGCPDGEVHFLTGGTQTNAVVIDSLLRPYQGVIAAASGHIAAHEAGAIEYGGHKVMTAAGKDGKISAADIAHIAESYAGDDNRDHLVMPGMVYISQPTELGTLYSLQELTEISAVCRRCRLPLFVDGARLAYALASQENDVTLKDMGKLCDIFYIGGTKCGLLFGEAVVMTRKNMIPHFFSMMKQHGALLAKGRLLGVQYDALFADGLYERIGRPAMESAVRIKAKLKELGIPMPVDSDTNQIFFVAENTFLEKLGREVEYGFIERIDQRRTMVRFATSWSTTEENTEKLLAVLERLMKPSAGPKAETEK